MKYIKFILIIFALLLLLFWYFRIYRGVPKENPSTAARQNWAEQTSEEPPVLIKVLPLELGRQVPQWKFQVAFTTHAGSLDFDPVLVSVLADDQARSYPPLAWQGPGPGGHHRDGVLSFTPVSPLPKRVELKIKDVGGVPQRSFIWNLE